MNSTVTSKYQTTIPKEVREKLDISVNDVLEWVVEKGKVTIYPVHKNFLRFRNTVKVGEGDIEADLEHAREIQMEKYR